VYSTVKLLSELDSRKLVLTDRHVVLLDEAGMANTLTVARFRHTLIRSAQGAPNLCCKETATNWHPWPLVKHFDCCGIH
jgi:hypothetical protein